MAYDAKRKRVILFGGEDQNGKFYRDTWAWDGRNWTRINSIGPSPRIQFAMDYDVSRDRVVVFGGVSPKPEYLDDVWEFDGKTWARVR